MKQGKYSLIVFDWDGTLYDSAAFVVRCVQQALAECQYPELPEENIRQAIGLSLEQALRRNMPHLSPMAFADLVHAYKKCVAIERSKTSVTLFDGVRETLENLKNDDYWLAIATGKSRHGLDQDLSESGLSDYFLMTCCAEEFISKPAPDMLLHIMDSLGKKPSETVVIGDTIFDLQMAENADVDSIGVRYGVHDLLPNTTKTLRALINDIRELPSVLVDSSANSI